MDDTTPEADATTALLIATDGTITTIDLPAGDHGMLRALQHAVGGDIEAVRLRPGVPGVGYCYEDAKLRPHHYNAAATAICVLTAGDYIAGPFVVVGPLDANGNHTALTAIQLSDVRSAAAAAAAGGLAL